MTDETEPRGKDKPLVPRTAGGAAIIGVPVAAILSALGWGGQQLLTLDETVQRQQVVLDSREARIVKLEEIAAQAALVRSASQKAVDDAEGEINRIWDRSITQYSDMIQRIAKSEQAIVDLRLSIDNLRQGDVQFLFDRLNLLETKNHADK